MQTVKCGISSAMPSRNIVKEFSPEAYYHVYNRGVEKRIIFLDEEDYRVFLNLLKRYLSKTPTKDSSGREYEWLYPEMELLAYCLMPNHFHLFVYQHDTDAVTRLMRGVGTSYTMYFNRKYKRVGTLYQDRFKATHITNDSYLQHISRYIHLNPREYLTWEYSSLPFYLGKKQADWVRPERVLEIFKGSDYLEFVKDYIGHKEILEELKYDLADR